MSIRDVRTLELGRSKTYGTNGAGAITSTIDLKARGGTGKGARRIQIAGAGKIWHRSGADWSEDAHTVLAGHIMDAEIAQIATGELAVVESGVGAFPAVNCDGKTLVVRLDEGDDLDGGADVVITFSGASLTHAALVAQINAQLNAALPEPGGHPARVFAEDSGAGKTKLYSRGRGSGATVEIVSQAAEVATALNFSVGSTVGTNYGTPADDITAYW